MKILIIYGTTEGQTRKIAETISRTLQLSGNAVTLDDASYDPNSEPGEFDGILIGASVHAGSYQSSVNHYVREHAEVLNNKPSAFFSVSLTAAAEVDDDKQGLFDSATRWLEKTGWTPDIVEHIAGAFRYTKYNYFKKLLMRSIAKKKGQSTDTSEDLELTDWDQVDAFTHRFAEVVKGQLVS